MRRWAGAKALTQPNPAAGWEFLRRFDAAGGVPTGRVDPVDGMPPALHAVYEAMPKVRWRR